MKKKIPFLLICFTIFSAPLPAQGLKLDSLMNALSASKKDTTRAKLFSTIATYYSDKNRDSMMKYMRLTDSLSRELGFGTGITTTYILYANYYFHSGDYQKALDYNLKALKKKEEEGNKKGMVNSYRNIGSVYINSNNLEKALEYYEKAVTLALEIGAEKDIPSIYANMGVVYHKQHNYGKAMEMDLKAMKAAEQTGDQQTLSHIYNSMGKLFFDIGKKDENRDDLDKAADYLQRSLEIKQRMNDKKGIANTLGNMAEVYMEIGNRAKALECLEQGKVYAEETNFMNWLLEGYESLAHIYEQSGDYKNAYEYFRKFTQVRDTVEGAETKKGLAELQGKYDTEKKDKEIQLLYKDNELNHEKLSRQRLIIVVVAAGLLAVVSLAFFIYRGSKEKQRINSIIEEKNKSITDSIRYARRIQTAILPKETEMRGKLGEMFVFYKPKDIVSGDFYFFAESGAKTILAVADCTGHGVPGAFMSMIGNSLLKQIISEKGVVKPSGILDELNEGVREALKQHGSDSDTHDGMDIALCTIDKSSGKLEFAGANRNLYFVRKGAGAGEVEIKADKFAIGGLQEGGHRFTNHELAFTAGDTLYLSTDGYADQFGGRDGKKFRSRRFRELLTDLSKLPFMQEQSRMLEQTLVEWMGPSEQLDDILVMGVRL